MKVKISWKEAAKNLPQIPIPNQLFIETPRGDASLSIKKRGTYTVNGEKDHPCM